GCPHSAVPAEKACSCTLFAAKAERPVNQSCDKPLETYRHLRELASELCNNTVDHAAAHQGFSHYDILVPLGAVLQEILDRNGEVVIRIHQPRNWRHNSMPVRVRIVGECNLILIFQSNQPCHGIRTGTIHADLAVMVYRHK